MSRGNNKMPEELLVIRKILRLLDGHSLAAQDRIMAYVTASVKEGVKPPSGPVDTPLFPEEPSPSL